MSRSCFSIVFALLISINCCFGQTDTDPEVWNNIESSIHKKSNLETVLQRLEVIKKEAEKNDNAIELSRSMCYLMLIRDIKTEDTLYFHNSYFIDSILQGNSNQELKLYMHYLLAQRLWSFKTKYLRFNRARYETKLPTINYAALNDHDLDSLINYHFEQAKDLYHHTEFNNKREENIDKVLWLSSSPLTFLFRPNLFDIILYEQIKSNEKVEFSTDYKHLLSLSQDQFLDTLIHINKNNALLLYRQWLDSHRSEAPIYYFIETVSREYIFKSLTPYFDLDDQKKYEIYLRSIVTSKFPEVKARAVYQLCSLWKEWSLKYNQYDENNNSFNTSFKDYAVKAVNLYDENKVIFDNYEFLKRDLEKIRADIVFPGLRLDFNYENEKSKPMLLKIQYKNVPVFYYRIVRLNFSESLSYLEKNKHLLFSHQTVLEEKITLPLPYDYNNHRIFFKLPSLPSGKYGFIFSNQPIDTNNKFEVESFAVSGIAALHNDDRLYILDRTTGMPIKNAIVHLSITNKKKVYTKEAFSDEKGAIVLPRADNFDLMISHNTDSLNDEFTIDNDRWPDALYKKGENTNLEDFYDDNSEVMIFTDRGIYRPGQKVFFKALLVTKNPHTGEMMLLNKQNLKNGFHNYLKSWLRFWKPILYLKDPFDRKIDSIKIEPNEYGSVSGAFTIPKNAATGDWTLEPDLMDVYSVNKGEFKVEEYKRPTFDISVDKPIKSYKIYDTIYFRVRLKSFSGSILNHTAIKYHIERQTDYIKFSHRNEILIDTIGYTDDNGVLEIKYFDSGVNSLDRNDDINIEYELSAQATDIAGETHDVNALLKLSTRPLILSIPLPGTVDLLDLKPLLISAKDKNGVPVSKEIEVKLYRVSDALFRKENDLSSYADQWIFSPQQFQDWFPDYHFIKNFVSNKDVLIYETKMNTANFEKFRWPVNAMQPGIYKIIVSSYEDGYINGENSKSFTIFNSQTKELPDTENSFFYLKANYLQTGDTVQLFSGNKYNYCYLIRQLKYYSTKDKHHIRIKYFDEKASKGIHEWKWVIPNDVKGNINISEVYIINNQLYHHEENIIIKDIEAAKPEIIVERYRSELHPGDSANFSVSIKTRNENIAAELMTTIYDASLDKLNKHQWELPSEISLPKLYGDWSINISTNEFGEFDFYQKPIISFIGKPVWWMDSTKYSGSSSFNFLDPEMHLQGRAAGVQITNGMGLNEVVVVGYGTRKKELTGAVSLQIRGISSLESYKQPLMILDGVPLKGDLSSVNLNDVTQAIILKGADAVNLYGSAAANGVLIISTKGEIQLPFRKPEPLLKIRSNFNETAFFAPAIHADKDGFFTFNFRMPESVTEWNWKLFAHTKTASFVYKEEKLVTQLSLMVQPHLPLSLYQGDHIVLKTRLANLDTLKRIGVVTFNIVDAITGEEIKSQFSNKINFNIDPKSTIPATFLLKVPEELLHPLKVIITARTNEFSDGEEHIIPILSKKILVKQNQSFHLFSKDTLIPIPKSLDTLNLYGVELSLNPKPQSALLNSLPYLAHYSFDCAEQMFNKLFAYETAINLVRSDSAIQNLIQKSSNNPETNIKEKDPDSLYELVMPWLTIAGKEESDRVQLKEILDTMKSKIKVQGYLEKLISLQNNDGGISWFKGGASNSYISAYILAGFGKLKNYGWNQYVKNSSLSDQYEDFIKKLCHYTDEKLENDTFNLSNDVWMAYARSFWQEKFPVSKIICNKIKIGIGNELKHENSLQTAALLIINSVRYFTDDPEIYGKAIQTLQSLKQSAINDENGLRWKAIADADSLETSAEEDIALLIEAYQAGKLENEVVSGIIKWLMLYKSEQKWHTTKGVAAIIDILTKEINTISGNTHLVEFLFNKKSITVSNDILSGNTSAFYRMNNLESVHLRKEGKETISGNIGWYYFSQVSHLNELNKEISINKIWYHFISQTKGWELSDSSTIYKVGDKVKIAIELQTPKALKYVWINDNRSAAFEPEEYNSGYQFGPYFGYYQSIHDASVDFFAEFIPSGKTKIEYEMRVTQEGKFAGGIAKLQCMYTPSITSYSNGGLIQVKE